jgi:hypothetical protein
MGVSNLYGIAINFNGDTDDMFEVFDNLAASPLSQYFSKEQLRLMEVSFEGSDGVYGIDDVEKKDRGFALAFHYAFKSPKERLEAMMKNIIANKGIFKPDISLTREMLIKGFEQVGNGHL